MEVDRAPCQDAHEGSEGVTDQERIAAYLERLETMSPQQLREEWTRVFKAPPPKAMSPTLVKRDLAYRFQAKVYGGLKPSLRKRLMSVLEDEGKLVPARRTKLAPGTRLVREWNGRTYIVDATQDGFLFDRKPYPSLSAIAREITGAHWNGRRFFGLTKSNRVAEE